jgi:adenylosuccinate lyase
MTAAEQWFERTLDDSANKRLSIPQLFLAADAALILALDICDGLVVYPNVINRHIKAELPFMATENIIMEAVKKGGDRQTLHERIRIHSIEASKMIKQLGQKNDLLERILKDDIFNLSREEIGKIMNINHFIGRAPQQTVEFIRNYIEPLLYKCKNYGFAKKIDLNV